MFNPTALITAKIPQSLAVLSAIGLKVFTMYGHSSEVGLETQTISTDFLTNNT